MINPETLLAGSRGRRLLLEYALASERMTELDPTRYRLLPAVSRAGYDLDPGRGQSRVMLSIGEAEPHFPTMSSEGVADALSEVAPAEVNDELLRDIVTRAVDSARYWEEPEGEDVLATTASVCSALRPFADVIAGSSRVKWWTSCVELEDQWAVNWQDNSTILPIGEPISDLDHWRKQVVEAEARAAQQAPRDLAANFTNDWWSVPSPFTLLHSSRSLFDRSPANLWWTEDAAGWQRASTHQIHFPEDVRVLEISDASIWTDLCKQYPLEVTDAKRPDWYRTTGRDGRWVIPDWSKVAREYDGVHLTVAAWLATAGAVIPVEDDLASLIAGWSPDETWWFIAPSSRGEVTRWQFESTFEHQRWVPCP